MPDATPRSEMLATTRRFLAREVDALAHDRAGRLAPRVLAGAAELGLFGLAIPERLGGLGLELADVAVIVAEIARADRSLATTVGLHNGLGTRALIELASPEQQEEWLPPLARGEHLAAFAATEPGAGSDLAAVRTTFRRDPGGLRLDGEKAYVTNAAHAGVFTVLARDADATGRATGLVVIPRGASGVEVGAEERKMGLRASSTCTVRLDGALVPGDHRLGPRGLEDAHRALAWGRVLLSAGCLGTARAALERSIEHASTRRQFGRALIELGAVRHHLAAIAAAERTIERVLAAACDSGDDLGVHAGALKVLASELTFDACDRAVQLHGALGFVEDPGVALLARDCRVTRIFEGANDVLLVRHGTAVLADRGLARNAQRAATRVARWSEVAARLEAVAQNARREHGVGAVRQQGLLQALARADIWLHAACCVTESMDGAREAHRVVLAHAGRRALERAERALSAAGRSEVESHHDDEVVEALVGSGLERALAPEVIA